MDKWSDLFPDGIVSPLWCLGFWCRCSYWSKNTLKSQLACRIREPERSYKKDLSSKSQAESEQENQQQEDWGPAGGEQQNVEWWRNKQSSVSRMQSGRSYSPNSRGKKKCPFWEMRRWRRWIDTERFPKKSSCWMFGFVRGETRAIYLPEWQRSVSLHIYLFVCLPACLSVNPSINMSIHLSHSICLSVFLLIELPWCLEQVECVLAGSRPAVRVDWRREKSIQPKPLSVYVWQM